jgi:putative addiction module component (TIGR02574 family)
MASPARDLEAVLLALPRSERARLAERLLASLDEESEVEEAWAAEIRSRLERFRAGELDAVSASSVHQEARRRLKR